MIETGVCGAVWWILLHLTIQDFAYTGTRPANREDGSVYRQLYFESATQGVGIEQVEDNWCIRKMSELGEGK